MHKMLMLLYLIAFEGLLKISETPVLHRILREYPGKATVPDPFDHPKDDLRFVFGMKFDAGKLFHLLKTSI
jgi:hypothetical protein